MFLLFDAEGASYNAFEIPSMHTNHASQFRQLLVFPDISQIWELLLA